SPPWRSRLNSVLSVYFIFVLYSHLLYCDRDRRHAVLQVPLKLPDTVPCGSHIIFVLAYPCSGYTKDCICRLFCAFIKRFAFCLVRAVGIGIFPGNCLHAVLSQPGHYRRHCTERSTALRRVVFFISVFLLRLPHPVI